MCLLEVILIIGVLASIALPSFLNQANKARLSEAKTYIGSVNRGQQTYYLEKGVFASTIAQLDDVIPTQTENYDYSIPSGDFTSEAIILASPKAESYIGAGGRTYLDNTSTKAIVCEGIEGAAPSMSNVTVEGGCP